VDVWGHPLKANAVRNLESWGDSATGPKASFGFVIEAVVYALLLNLGTDMNSFADLRALIYEMDGCALAMCRR